MTISILNQGFLFLTIAILTNVIGTVFMKLSDGLKKLTPGILLFICYIISFIAMTFALRYMDLGQLYAIWSGVGTILVAIIGSLYFQEAFTYRKGLFLLFIIIGIVGIHAS